MEKPTQDLKKNTTYIDLSKQGNSASFIIEQVYVSLKERGYNPINQFVGYIMSGDPTYITNYGGARALVTQAERDELLDEFVRFYLDHLSDNTKNGK